MTQVNEILTQMENFSGLFVCSSNFKKNMDSATFRRFNLKFEFDYLTKKGVLMNFPEQTYEPFHLPETLSAGKTGQKIKKIAQSAVSKDSATYRFNQTEILQSLLRTHKIVTVEAHKLKGFFLPVILAKAKMLS